VKATEVTAVLAESNGSLLPGLWRDSLHVTCGLTACTRGSAPGPTLGNEYGKSFFMFALCCILEHFMHHPTCSGFLCNFVSTLEQREVRNKSKQWRLRIERRVSYSVQSTIRMSCLRALTCLDRQFFRGLHWRWHLHRASCRQRAEGCQ